MSESVNLFMSYKANNNFINFINQKFPSALVFEAGFSTIVYFGIFFYSILKLNMVEFGLLGILIAIGALFRAMIFDPLLDMYVREARANENKALNVEITYLHLSVFLSFLILAFFALVMAIKDVKPEIMLLAFCFSLNLLCSSTLSLGRQKLMINDQYKDIGLIFSTKSILYAVFCLIFFTMNSQLLSLIASELISTLFAIFLLNNKKKYNVLRKINSRDYFVNILSSSYLIIQKVARQSGNLMLTASLGFFGGLEAIGIYNRLDTVFRAGRKVFSAGVVEVFYVKYCRNPEHQEYRYWFLAFLYLFVIYVVMIIVLYFLAALSTNSNFEILSKWSPLFAAYWFSLGVASFNVKALKARKEGLRLILSGVSVAMAPNLGVLIAQYYDTFTLMFGWCIGGFVATIFILFLPKPELYSKKIGLVAVCLGNFFYFIIYNFNLQF